MVFNDKTQRSIPPCKASRLRHLHGVRLSQNKLLALLLDDYLKEEACMKYINAKDILPNALVKELQNYIQGGYIYVPTNQLHQKRWGEISGYRQELQQRNQQIIEEFQKGSSVEKLSEKYFLSVYAIRKIIYKK